jgi:hypothetical protein
MAQPLGGSTSKLGQFADEFQDQLKAGDTAADVAFEPAKILEQILGGKPTGQSGVGETSIEQDPAGTKSDDPQAQLLKQQTNYQQKVQAEQKKSQALLSLHQQKLQEEIQYYEQKKQEKQVEEQQKEQAEENSKTGDIVQLQHEREKEETLGSAVGQQQGSKEAKAWGAG